MPAENDDSPIIDVTPHPAGFVPRNDVWAFLRRRKGLIAICWLIGSVAVTFWLLWRPYRYEAESRVMITRIGAPSPITDAEMASEIELVRDPSHIAKAAFKDLASASDALIQERRQLVEHSLDVAPAGKSSLLAIEYRDHDPVHAAQVVNQIVDLYLAERRVIFQPGGATRAAAAIPNNTQTDPLINFDVVNRGPQLAKALEVRTQQGIDLEARVGELQAAIRDNQESSNTLRKRLASIPERIHTRTRTRTGAELSSKTVEKTESINPLRQEVEAALLKSDSALAGLRARLEVTQAAVLRSRTVEDRLSILSSERQRLERQLEDKQTRLSSAGDAGSRESDRGGTLRATLINRAEPPLSPLPRYNWLWIPIGILAALALAFVIAWFIDWFDRPIYTPDDFEEASGAPPIDRFARGAGA
jgi:uncharacterized protein involved in exopolysaccharide biosynthesis